MSIDEFLQLLKKRRSIRMFKPDPIPDEYVQKILEAARWAMSGANGQPWEFIVVKDAKTKDKIGDIYMESKKDTYEIEKTRIEELRHPQYSSPPKGKPGFIGAPVLLVVCGDRRTFQATVLGTHFFLGGVQPGDTYAKNVGNAIHNMHLAAAALGLGSQWVTVQRDWEQALKRLLDVPDLIEIHAIVPVGFPGYEPGAAYRRELEEMVHIEKYDHSKFRSTGDIVKFIYKLRGKTAPAYPDKSSAATDS
jgi:nitroreductase